MSNVTLKTNHGDIVITLDTAKAPNSAANFEQYVKDGHFNGTVFHRVIPGFMIQGGGFDQTGQQKGTRSPIQNEANNGLKNDKYTLAMARTNDPHSATAQFFINIANNDFLNHKSPSAQGWGYAVFGAVTAGQEVVDKIGGVRTARKGMHDDWPVDAVIITEAVLG